MLVQEFAPFALTLSTPTFVWPEPPGQGNLKS